VILHQMEETRTALQDKVEKLEEQVKETVASATEAVETVKETVQETVSTVKETVQETVESVKDTLDVSHQVDRHPWAMVLGATAIGYIGGRILLRMMEAPPSPAAMLIPPQRAYQPLPESTPRVNEPTHVPFRQPEPPPGPSLKDTVMEYAGPELKQLKGLALGTLGAVVRQLATESAPPQLKEPIENLVDDFTTKLGGQRIEGNLFDSQASECASEACSRESQFTPQMSR